MVFDIAYLLPIPNLTLAAPANELQFNYLLEEASKLKRPTLFATLRDQS